MTRFKGLTTHPSGCSLGHRTSPSEPCRATASALQLLQVPLITGGPGLFSPDTLLTPSFSFPSHWLGGDRPPVVRAPWAPHSVTKHLTAGHHLLACRPTHSWHCPALTHPQGAHLTLRYRSKGRGRLGAPGAEVRKDGWFSWLVWDPCYAAMPLWTLRVVFSGQPCRGGEGKGGQPCAPGVPTAPRPRRPFWPTAAAAAVAAVGAGRREGPWEA